MEKKEHKKEEEAGKAAEKIAVIRVKGPNKKGKSKNDTMNMLKLYRKNYCVVIGKSPSFAGMLKKISDCVTWGEIDDPTMEELAAKRGEKTRLKGKEGQKKFFRLNPPKGGYGRKGIKTPFSIGGALGYRGKKINDLIRRML